MSEQEKKERRHFKKNSVNQEAADYIIGIIKADENCATGNLLKLLKEKYGFSEKAAINLLIQLNNENKIVFRKKEPIKFKSIREFITSSSALWYWVVLAFVAATITTFFVSPNENYPWVYVRSFFGLVFTFWLPGFAFIKMLFPQKIPIESSFEIFDKIVFVALSLGSSIVLVPVVGLILNFSPWGLWAPPTILSLSALIEVFSTLAVVRRYQKNQQIIQMDAPAPRLTTG